MAGLPFGFNFPGVQRDTKLPLYQVSDAKGNARPMGDLPTGLVKPYDISMFNDSVQSHDLGFNDNVPVTDRVDFSDGAEMTMGRLMHMGFHFREQTTQLNSSTGLDRRGDIATHPPAKYHCLPSLNHYLASEEGRLQYGRHTNPTEILDRFIPYGFLLTAPNTIDVKTNANAAFTFVTKGRVRTRDIWLYKTKEGNYVHKLDKLYLVLVRKSLTDELRKREDSRKKTKQRKQQERQIKMAANRAALGLDQPPSSSSGITFALSSAAAGERKRGSAPRAGSIVNGIRLRAGQEAPASSQGLSLLPSSAPREVKQSSAEQVALNRAALDALLADTARDNDDDDEFGFDANVSSALSGSSASSQQQQQQPEKDIPDTYWQWIPIAIRKGSHLLSAHYNGNDWIGHKQHIGTVWDIFGADPALDLSSRSNVEKIVAPLANDPSSRDKAWGEVREIEVRFNNLAQTTHGG